MIIGFDRYGFNMYPDNVCMRTIIPFHLLKGRKTAASSRFSLCRTTRYATELPSNSNISNILNISLEIRWPRNLITERRFTRYPRRYLIATSFR
eukprot:29786_6